MTNDTEGVNIEPPEDITAPITEPSEDYDYTPPTDFSQFEESPDLLTIRQAAELANATPDVIKAWVEGKRLRLFTKRQKDYIPAAWASSSRSERTAPKLALIEFLKAFQA